MIGAALYACYKLADYNVLFTRVPEGEIIGITYSEKIGRFMGNMTGYWIHPRTGQVHSNEEAVPDDVSLPKDLFGTGIYWLGIPPFAQRYTYEFHWNKWAKPVDPATGLEKTEYAIIPRQAIVDSIYFRAQYPVQVNGCETKEGVPLTMTILITVQVDNADTAWFKIKSPGWLSALNGQVTAVLRDWVGGKTLEEINTAQAEIPSMGHHSEFQLAFFTLNESTVGNLSIKTMLGAGLSGVHFVGYSIDEARNPTQRISIEKYFASKEGEAAIEKARLEAIAAQETAQKTRTEAEAAAFATEKQGEAEASAKLAMAKANAEATILQGEAEASAIRTRGEAEAHVQALVTKAVKDNPHYGAMVLSVAIKDQKAATTLVVNANAVPTIPLTPNS
ncbi:MAG TPA: SPFH domain-containing protein [Candidatus Paceibacterota bacterium]